MLLIVTYAVHTLKEYGAILMKWIEWFCQESTGEQDSLSLLGKACFSSVTEPATQQFKGKFI